MKLKSLELIGKRHDIFEKLSKKKYYVIELAKELHKSPPEMSKHLKELEENELVECEQEEGKRVKYYHVCDYARNILTAVNHVTPKPKQMFEEWQINEFLSILEGQDLSDDVRMFYSNSFHHICSEYPIEVISSERTRLFLEKVVADPFHDKVTEDLMRSVSAILPYTLRSKEWSGWALKKLYPIFAKNIESQDQKIRIWALRSVGTMASLCAEIKNKVEKEFLTIWFSNDTDPNSEFGKEVEQQLVGLSSRCLFEQVRAKAKKPDEKIKAKAETLLKGLKECLLPK